MAEPVRLHQFKKSVAWSTLFAGALRSVLFHDGDHRMMLQFVDLPEQTFDFRRDLPPIQQNLRDDGLVTF